jgi:phasin family protein
MITEMQEFVSEQTQAMASRARKFGKAPVKSVRAAAVRSADGIATLKSPVRAISRAGVKFAAVSLTAVQDLIELESDMVTSTMTDAATRLKKAARADGVAELVRGQAQTLRASGERIAGDVTRAVEIVTDAGQDIRRIATLAIANVAKAAEARPAKAKGTAHRAVRKTVKASPAARKTAVRRRRKVAKPAPASTWSM